MIQSATAIPIILLLFICSCKRYSTGIDDLGYDDINDMVDANNESVEKRIELLYLHTSAYGQQLYSSHLEMNHYIDSIILHIKDQLQPVTGQEFYYTRQKFILMNIDAINRERYISEYLQDSIKEIPELPVNYVVFELKKLKLDIAEYFYTSHFGCVEDRMPNPVIKTDSDTYIISISNNAPNAMRMTDLQCSVLSLEDQSRTISPENYSILYNDGFMVLVLHDTLPSSDSIRYYTAVINLRAFSGNLPGADFRMEKYFSIHPSK